MAKYSRVTAKVFGETASTSNTPKEIGQFGSAKAGTYNATGDVATIQNLTAWSNGWVDAVTPTQQFPSLPEMTGVHKVLSYQEAYLLQQGIAEWDSATTYYTNNFCAKNGKIYISQTDENLNNDPESDTVNWQEFVSVFRNIGEIVQSTIPLIDAGLHLLDGSLLAYGSYQAFIDYIGTLYDSGDYSSLFTTEANWQTSNTNYGACDKFVYDSVNNTVRLPKRTTEHGDLIKYYSSGTSWYRIYSDGWCEQGGVKNLTNVAGQTLTFIKSFLNTNYTLIGVGEGTDATSNLGITAKGTSSVTLNPSYGGDFDWMACGYVSVTDYQYSPIYEYIVVATSSKTQIQVDIDEIATDLNGKADVDLTNVNNSGTSTGAGWAMPSGTYEDLTLGANYTTYTAPANGWYFFGKVASSVNQYIVLTNATAGSLTNGAIETSSGHWLYVYMPAKKGQQVQVSYTASGETKYFRFIYAVGSESEYTP